MVMSRQDAEDALNLAKQNLNTADELAEVYNRISGILDDQNRSISAYMNSQKMINDYKRKESLLNNEIAKGKSKINEFLKAGIDLDDDRILLLKKELEILEKL